MKSESYCNPINYWYQKYLKEKLTWKDIRRISKILEQMIDEEILGEKETPSDEQAYYEEVLRRFKENG